MFISTLRAGSVAQYCSVLLGTLRIASGAHAAVARSALGTIFITSLPPARTQPRAKLPKPAIDVDEFLKVNASDKTPLTFRLRKGFPKKGSLLRLLFILLLLCTKDVV